MSYESWLLVHITGVIVFFSNAVAAVFWRGRAEKTRDPRFLAHAYRALVTADSWLTAPSVVATLAGGIGAARSVGLPVLRTGWILWSLVAFGVSGLVFALRVLPLQLRLAAEAEEAVRTGAFDSERHDRQAAAWAFWAHLSLLAAAVAVVLMVLKPILAGS